MPRRTRRMVFLDTSFIIALENKDDEHHEHALRLARELDRRPTILLLHWGVLLETGDGYAKLDRRQKGEELLAMIETGDRYSVRPITESLLKDARQRYRTHKDKEWGLTDCVSFALMDQENIKEALTADEHFRQAGFKALLLETP